ncbi:MAG: hypothetical protein ACD_73C00136G0001 [uncultured bacterium]|nr:MAG: hypothetical protein ACD_73C00136G0001 [uncultured bacterium]
MTSPFPDKVKIVSLSATIKRASSLLNALSVRQSLANSTAARIRLPLNSFSFPSNFSKSVNASAVEPAKPVHTLPSRRVLIFLAVALITVFCNVTWPSPAMATRPFLLTAKIVVLLIFI